MAGWTGRVPFGYWTKDGEVRSRMDEMEGAAVRLWKNLVVSKVKSPLPRFTS